MDALGGAPGVYSARFAGEGHDDAANNAMLMKKMADVPNELRTCHFSCCIALARRGLPVLVAEGKAEGILLRAPSGENGFGYDPYFFYPPLNKSFAELSPHEKNAVSHRRAALDALRTSPIAENRSRCE